MAAGNVVYPEETKPPFRGRHGAGAQGIPAAVRPAASGGVHGRDEQAARVTEVREKLPVRPGSPEKYDAHYLRRGECARCGCSASRCPAGGEWLSPNGARRWIGRSKCAHWRICRVPGMRKASRWCATT